MNEDIVKQLRKTIVKKMAEDLCSVQPMPSDAIKNLIESSVSEAELKKEGYRPVDETTKLMWIKND
jgi:hypothetical protein